MKQIYDLGYSNIKPDKMLTLLVQLDAVLVDARFSPRSRVPQWNGGPLQNALGERYLHVKMLGNRNYKGGPIEYVDLQAGIGTIASLAQDRNVVIMCQCWNRPACHRLGIVEEFERVHGVKSIDLTREMIAEIIDGAPKPPDPQLRLF